MLVLRFNKNLLIQWSVRLFGLMIFIFPILVLSNTNTQSLVSSQKIQKHVKHKYWTKDYDSYFKKYSKHYFGVGFSWHWFKAQSIAESSLDSNATSKVGAVGLMQILPSTYSDIIKKNPALGDIKHPRWNIAAGIFYDRQIYRKWKKKGIPVSERLAFTFASYNAGHSKVLRAYNKSEAEKTNQWLTVKALVPGATRAYVRRINSLMNY